MMFFNGTQNLLAAVFENGYWNCLSSESLSVILTGVVVVFCMLLVLILAIKLIGSVFGSMGKNAEEKKAAKAEKAAAKAAAAAKKAAEAAAKAAPVAKAAPAPAATADQGGVIAAISAAVYMMLGHGNFKIKSVKKAEGGRRARNAWKMAGMQDNTRPF